MNMKLKQAVETIRNPILKDIVVEFIELLKCCLIFIGVTLLVLIIITILGMKSFDTILGYYTTPAFTFWGAIYLAQKLVNKFITLPKRLHFWVSYTYYLVIAIIALGFGISGTEFFWFCHHIAEFIMSLVFLAWIIAPYTQYGNTQFTKHSISSLLLIILSILLIGHLSWCSLVFIHQSISPYFWRGFWHKIYIIQFISLLALLVIKKYEILNPEGG